MFKRILAIVLVTAMLVTAALAASQPDSADSPENRPGEALEHAVDNGLLDDRSDEMTPEDTLTRAQMAVIITRAFGATETVSLFEYRDVNADAWYYTELSRAVRMDTIQGSDGKLRPEEDVTNQEAFVTLARLFVLNSEDTSALDAFSDGEEVDPAAREAVAAMVEAGYVSGTDGKLSPNETMTCEEFIELLDTMVAVYVDEDTKLESSVTGNVMVRADGVTLKDLTVHGDLILADSVSAAVLINVTIEGRLIIRGGSKALNLNGVKAEQTIVDNPNVVSRLNITNCDLGEVHLRSDVIVNGYLGKVVEEGGRVLDNSDLNRIPSAPNRKPGSKPNPEAETKPQTKPEPETKPEGEVKPEPETKPEPEEKPEPETKPEPEEKPEPETKPEPEAKPEPEPKPEPEAATLVEQAKLVDMGWSQFVAVQFASGKSLNNCTLTVDGVQINDAVTPVTDDGSVVKWEISELGHAKLVVSDGISSQTITLGTGAGKAPAVVQGAAPEYFLLNGPVYVWDYHLTNYDDAGNIRVEPAKTTFGIDAVSGATSIAHFSPDAIIHEDPDVFGKVTGTVELMFNYAEGSEAEKAFVDGITDVDLVSFQEYKQTLNDNLTYTLDKETVHGDHTVACIKVPVGQTNFMTNGRYRLRVTSNGTAHLFPIHLVNEVVPSMTVTGDTGYSGKEVHFRIENMTYGITRPIYRVELTNPAGETFDLAKFDDWFLHGDLLVLYNDHTNYFPVDGNYTVKVWADGFQPFEKTFHQTAFTSEAPKGVPVDAISTASVGGGSSSGGEGGGDTNVMNANLILNADLLVNAEIIKSMGFENEAARGISERWETMQALYVFNQGGETVYTYDSYYDAVNAAKTQGRHLTFAQYIQSGSAVTTENRPYAVKQILEDNLLGETSSFGEAMGETAPILTLTAQTESTAVFSCTDKVYLEKMAEGELFLNTTYPALTADQYVVDAEAGTLTLNTVTPGRNTLKITVPGYKTAEVIFEIEKVLEEVQLTAEDITKGGPLVITCGAAHDSCDFFANVTSVKMVAPNNAERVIHPDGEESIVEEIGYTVEGNALTIGKDIFDEGFTQNEDGTFQSGVYKVVMMAEFYGEKTVVVNVTESDKPVDPSEELEAPAPVSVKKHFYTGDYQIIFGMSQDAYMKAISSVTVNGEKVNHQVNNITDGLMTVPAASMNTDTDNIVVISAAGYKDLTLIIALDASGNPTLRPNAPVEPENAAAPVVASITEGGVGPGAYQKIAFEAYENITAYLNAITSITLNGTEAAKVTNLWNEHNAYKLSVTDDSQSLTAYDSIDFSADCFGKGEVNVAVTAEGYEALTFHVTDGALGSPEPTLPAAPAVSEITYKTQFMGGNYYVVAFAGTEDEAAAYVDAISEITVGGKKVKCVASFWNDTMSYKTANDIDNGGAYRFLHFTEDCFAGEKTVVICAEGYEDLTFSVAEGSLAQ